MVTLSNGLCLSITLRNALEQILVSNDLGGVVIELGAVVATSKLIGTLQYRRRSYSELCKCHLESSFLALLL